MKTIVVSGQVMTGSGCAVSVTLFNGSSVVSVHHYHGSFQDGYAVPPGPYTITIQGLAEGAFRFSVAGGQGTSAEPPVGITFQNQISGVYQLKVQ